MPMLSNVSKWGNSLGIRIPRVMTEQLGISEGVPVELFIEGDHLIIHKVYTLESLVSQITPDNIHAAVDEGPATGKEVW